jgi:hypothetical protein
MGRSRAAERPRGLAGRGWQGWEAWAAASFRQVRGGRRRSAMGGALTTAKCSGGRMPVGWRGAGPRAWEGARRGWLRGLRAVALGVGRRVEVAWRRRPCWVVRRAVGTACDISHASEWRCPSEAVEGAPRHHCRARRRQAPRAAAAAAGGPRELVAAYLGTEKSWAARGVVVARAHAHARAVAPSPHSCPPSRRRPAAARPAGLHLARWGGAWRAARGTRAAGAEGPMGAYVKGVSIEKSAQPAASREGQATAALVRRIHKAWRAGEGRGTPRRAARGARCCARLPGWGAGVPPQRF